MGKLAKLFIIACVAMTSVGVILAVTMQEPPASTAPGGTSAAAPPPPNPFPGVTRIGEAKARELWADLPNQPGYYKRQCAPETMFCTVAMDPAVWRQLPYDLKRDVMAGIGIGAAAVEGAHWTTIVDMYTGKELARYSARYDRVDIE